MEFLLAVKYSYATYKIECLIWPLIIFVLFLILFTSDIMSIKKKRNFFRMPFFITFVLSAIFLVVSGIELSHGYKLLFDKEDDIIKTMGQIEKIEKVFPPKFLNKDNDLQAHWLYISGEKYYIMSASHISLNDHVEVFYLKNSKFIVEINVY